MDKLPDPNSLLENTPAGGRSIIIVSAEYLRQENWFEQGKKGRTGRA